MNVIIGRSASYYRSNTADVQTWRAQLHRRTSQRDWQLLEKQKEELLAFAPTNARYHFVPGYRHFWKHDGKVYFLWNRIFTSLRAGGTSSTVPGPRNIALNLLPPTKADIDVVTTPTLRLICRIIWLSTLDNGIKKATLTRLSNFRNFTPKPL